MVTESAAMRRSDRICSPSDSSVSDPEPGPPGPRIGPRGSPGDERRALELGPNGETISDSVIIVL